MTGSLQTKNDVYYMVVNTKNAEGKRKQKWISTGLSVKGNSEPSKLLFCDYIVKWVELYRKNIQPKTHETNMFNLKKHVYPYFSTTGLTLSGSNTGILRFETVGGIEPKHGNPTIRNATGGSNPCVQVKADKGKPLRLGRKAEKQKICSGILQC